MKMIYVFGDDYAALEFEKYYNGSSVKEVIDRVFIGREEHNENFGMRLYEFGNIDPDFINFVRRKILDHDQAKHENFYFENEIIGRKI